MKIQSGRIALALWLAALLMAGCATPQDKQAQADRDALCAALDTNKDGKITKEEFMAKTTDKAKALEVFEKCDTDKKGYLTYDEIWSQRMMLPPELIITTPPLAPAGRGRTVDYRWSRGRGSGGALIPLGRNGDPLHRRA